ncbi:MAG TPA: cache domain-containing protein, partial [Polyangia bacterium]|nr:cache domain-containing protein [Polyangia bacterium]
MRLSIKWKIFVWCFGLALAIVAFNYWFTTELVKKTTDKSSQELQGTYRRYKSFEQSYGSYMAAAASVWATSPQLRQAFAKDDDAAAKPIIAQLEQSLAQTVKPAFVMLFDKRGDVTSSGAIDASQARGLRAVADVRAGLAIKDGLLENDGRAYLIAGEPVLANGETVGGLLIGVHLETVFGEFKRQTDDDPKKQVELALVHNQRTTASAAHADDWDDLARATRPEARETITEGGEKIQVLSLPDGQHDFFAAQLNGYEGSTLGSVGSLFFLRNRVERVRKMDNLIRDTFTVAAFALGLA